MIVFLRQVGAEVTVNRLGEFPMDWAEALKPDVKMRVLRALGVGNKKPKTLKR
jgi:hypothetical protein